jgi:hypothetical protein
LCAQPFALGDDNIQSSAATGSETGFSGFGFDSGFARAQRLLQGINPADASYYVQKGFAGRSMCGTFRDKPTTVSSISAVPKRPPKVEKL